MPNGLVAARPGTPLSRHYPSQGSQIQLSPDLYRPTKLPPLSAPMLIPCGPLIANQSGGSPIDPAAAERRAATLIETLDPEILCNA
jgi:hypothetical protein